MSSSASGGASGPAPALPVPWWRRLWADLTLQEMSGAFGDLGTLLPLLVGLTKDAGLNLGTTLLFTGAYNVATGLAFGIPMPVQPMKTIAAVALSQAPLTVPQIMAAGLFVSGCVVLLGLTRLFGLVSALVPGAVIRGMQLGLGLQLALKGWRQAWYADGHAPPARGWWGPEGLLLGLLALAFILISIYPPEAAPGSLPAQQPPPQQQRRADVEQAEPASSAERHNGVTRRAALGANGQAAGAAAGGHAEGLDCLGGASSAAELEGGAEEAGSDDKLALLPRGSSNDNGAALLNSGGSCGAHVHVAALRSALLACRNGLERLGRRAERGLDGPPCSPAVGEQAIPRTACGGSGNDVSRSACGGGGGGGAGGARVPAAALLVGLGILLTLCYRPEVVRTLRLGPSPLQLMLPSVADWRVGVLQAGLPQLALTGLNSVLGVCQLAARLFPDRPASPDRVALSVGAMNLVGCWFGAMPCCHGAGGLAAQARFGARSGAAPAFLGVCKMVLGLAFGSSLLALLQAFPRPLLGAMLVFAGLELAACSRGQRGQRGRAVLLLTAAVTLATSNTGVGVLAGLAAAYLLLAADAVREMAALQVLRRR